VAGRERHGKYIPTRQPVPSLPFSLISPYNSKSWPKASQDIGRLHRHKWHFNRHCARQLSKRLLAETIIWPNRYSAAATNAQEQ
jgi:hypothetical protein